MPENIDDKPVVILLDKDGYLVRVGTPDSYNERSTKKEMSQIVLSGGSVLNMTLGEYKAKKYTWIWDKPKENNAKVIGDITVE